MRPQPAPARPVPPVRWAALVAALAGIAGALAFPRVNAELLIFTSVAGLSWAVDGRRSRTGAWLGVVYGATFFGPLLHWTGVYVGAVPWLLLTGVEVAVLAGLGAVLPLVQRLPGAPFWIATAWVLQEAVRDRAPFGGFPWGRLAFSQADSPLRWLAALGGQPLLSFAVAFVGGALAVAARQLPAVRRSASRPGAWRPLAGCLAGLIAVPAVAGIRAAVGNDGGPNHPLRVALIQGSVPDRGLAFEDRAREVLDNHVQQTLRLAADVRAGRTPRPDLVVWPENASDVDPFRDPSARAEISAAVRAVGAPVLVGAILQGPGADHRRNAGILWSPTSGPGAVYLKRHPVPFAEYMPLRSIADRVSSAAKLVTQDMIAGHGNGLLRGGPVPLGDVICFEVAYDQLVQSSVAAGAQLLVVQTNNATFGHTAETYQQLAMTRLRAVETGRTTLQVSTTGVSAVIGPDGGVRAEAAKLFTPAVLTATVPARTAQTLAVRLGAGPEYVLAALAVLGAAGSVLTARRRARRRVDSRTDVSTPEPEAGMVVR